MLLQLQRWLEADPDRKIATEYTGKRWIVSLSERMLNSSVFTVYGGGYTLDDAELAAASELDTLEPPDECPDTLRDGEVTL